MKSAAKKMNGGKFSKLSFYIQHLCCNEADIWLTKMDALTGSNKKRKHDDSVGVS